MACTRPGYSAYKAKAARKTRPAGEKWGRVPFDEEVPIATGGGKMVHLGMTADKVLKTYGKPIDMQVLGEEPEQAQEVVLPTGGKATI